jgi:hypothetical protein
MTDILFKLSCERSSKRVLMKASFKVVNSPRVNQDRLQSCCESHFTPSHSVRGKLISLTQRFELPKRPCNVELVKIMFSEGGACSAYGGQEKRIQGFGGET